MTAPIDPQCPSCGGVVRPLSVVAYRGVSGTLGRCQKCGRREARLTPAATDPKDAVAFVRRRLNALLKPARRAAHVDDV